MELDKNCGIAFQVTASDCEAKRGEEEKVVEEQNITGESFWPIICLLKFLGNCPLSYVSTRDTSVGNKNDDSSPPKMRERKVYTIDYGSPLTLFSFAHGGLVIAVYIILLYETVSGEDVLYTGLTRLSDVSLLRKDETHSLKNERVSGLHIIVKRILFFIINALQILLSWIESRDFGIFLNNFLQFQKYYLESFPFTRQLPQSNMNRIRNLFLVFYVLLPAAVMVPMTALYFNASPELSTVGMFFTIILVFRSIFISLLEDVKVILTYYALRDALKQVKIGVVYSKKWEKITAHKVKAWKSVIHTIRSQAILASEWQKCHQLMLAMGATVLITLTAFDVVDRRPDNHNYPVGMAAFVAFILLIAGRIYVKVNAATLMSYEESMIARELICINVPEDELSVQLEVKFLHDMMTHEPCVINFGGYATLNKKFILRISSQVVTYLIVMMQFSNSRK